MDSASKTSCIVTSPSIITDYALSTTRASVLSDCEKMLEDRSLAKLYVVNAHILCEGLRDEGYRRIVGEASLSLCDGVNVLRMVRWTSGRDVELYPGPDFFDDVVIKKKLGEWRHYFLGGSKEVSSGLRKRFPSENHKFHSPPFRASAELFDYEEPEFSPYILSV